MPMSSPQMTRMLGFRRAWRDLRDVVCSAVSDLRRVPAVTVAISACPDALSAAAHAEITTSVPRQGRGSFFLQVDELLLAHVDSHPRMVPPVNVPGVPGPPRCSDSTDNADGGGSRPRSLDGDESESRSSSGRTLFFASSNHASISSLSFSGCSSARFFASGGPRRRGRAATGLVEMARCPSGVHGRRLPALLPDAARAEHRVVLRFASCVGASASSKV